MKRRNDEADKEAEIPSRRPSQIFQRSDGPLHLVTSQPDESWRGFEAIDPPGQPSRHNQSASFSYGPPYGSHQSPTQGAQSMMMLPSPSSLNLPMPPTFPAISSPSPYTQTSVHNTHLQDLQHQVSVKTLAFQTLQREYDTIIQKIERSRIRTQTLEKKFEVSDAEIKSLSEEKERLTMQVQQLETQIETLQHAKDDARRTGAESAAQYMKIVEMAGQIQAQGVDSRKNWEKEKGELLDRIKLLELGRSSNPIGPPASRPASSGGVVSHSEPIQASTSDAQLRALLIRNEALEGALKAAKEESKSMREAALVLAGAGQRIETALDKALGDEIPQP
ncbi:hypothetical protein EJ08DRAFT_337193 [Tothia fuscella]|uniref:Uncharacterized protein n=1 Tax=Tothia fuscella TaxID=1048955 RepID=A0A9P4P1X2_9PEZI|nr:hypothetical protein EJ08DRAFT_337193 [Tothia fuscella]